jgi:hypothetical protein
MKLAVTLIVLATIASAAIAGTSTVTLSAESTAITQVAQVLSQQSGQSVVVDTGIDAKVSAQLNDMDIEKALDILTQSNGLKWEKLYAPVDDKGKIDITNVKTQLAILKSLSDKPIVVYDPTAKKQTVYAVLDLGAAEKKAEVSIQPLTFDPEKLGLKSFYFISNPKAATLVPDKPKKEAEPTKPPSNQVGPYADLRAQQNQMFLQMTPQERKIATEQEMQSMLNLPPDQLSSLLRAQRNAQRNIDPAIRNQLQQAMRQAGIGRGGGGGGRPGNRGGNRGGG